jgi:ABC-type uncharacterized transport system permease subunit
MEKQIFAIHEFILLLSGAVIFVLLFVVIYKILKQMSIFRGLTSAIVAVCVSLLSVIGLSQFFVIADVACKTTANRRDITLDVILLPYTALAIAVILSLILMIFNRIFKNHKMDKARRKNPPRRNRDIYRTR